MPTNGPLQIQSHVMADEVFETKQHSKLCHSDVEEQIPNKVIIIGIKDAMNRHHSARIMPQQLDDSHSKEDSIEVARRRNEKRANSKMNILKDFRRSKAAPKVPLRSKEEYLSKKSSTEARIFRSRLTASQMTVVPIDISGSRSTSDQCKYKKNMIDR